MRTRPTNLLILLFAPALLPAVAPWLARGHWLLDLASCFALHALVACAFATLICFLCSRFRWAMAFAAGFASATVAVGGMVANGAPGGSLRAEAFTVYAANLLFGNEDGADRLLLDIRENEPDVVFLSEVTPLWLERIQAGLHGYKVLEAKPADGPFGLALLARIDCREVELIDGGYDWSPAVRAVFDSPAGRVTVFGLHPPRPGGSKHNRERDTALAHLRRAVAATQGPRIVLGDLNAAPFNPAYRDFVAETGLRNAAGWRWLPTWTTHWPWLLRVPIDHILVEKSLAVQKIALGRTFGSDHAPIHAAIVKGY